MGFFFGFVFWAILQLAPANAAPSDSAVIDGAKMPACRSVMVEKIMHDAHGHAYRVIVEQRDCSVQAPGPVIQ